MTTTHTHDYGDRELNTLIKQLRSEVRGTRAAQTLTKVETHLRYIQRVMAAQDQPHAAHARQLLALGHYDAACSATHLIWSFDLRVEVLRQIHAHQPHAVVVEDAVALALEFDREILV